MNEIKSYLLFSSLEFAKEVKKAKIFFHFDMRKKKRQVVFVLGGKQVVYIYIYFFFLRGKRNK
jgi:hypothetical protein